MLVTEKANKAGQRYALVIHACDSCRNYPIEVLEVVGENYTPICSKCHSTKTHFEKAYAADYSGRVIE